MKRRFILGAAALLVAGTARTQTVRPAAANANDGAALYARRCAACHGDALGGGDHAPALKGAQFWSHWQGAPARPLYSRILSTMPADDPGSLSPSEALTLTAHLARANGHPLPATVAAPGDLDALKLAAGHP